MGLRTMKMIKPIVNISKVADNYDTFVLGFNGVLTDGAGIYPEAANALISLYKNGKKLFCSAIPPADCSLGFLASDS